MNRGRSSAANTSSRTRPAASRVASAISMPMIAAALRSSQPSPSTASACASPSARGSRPRTRASTRSAIPSRPPTKSSSGSSSASRRPSSSTARSSSATYRGLPPVAAHTAAHSPSLALPPTASRTIVHTAPSLKSPGRSHRQRLRTQRKRRSSYRRRLTGPQRDEDPQRHPLQPRRQIRQPPQRRLIHPLRIINGDQQRPTVCEIGSQPVQAVQDRKRRVIGCRPEQLSQQQRSRRASRAGKQRLALVQVGARQAPLKQLTHHPKREIRLKRRTTRQQDFVPEPRRPATRSLNQRRLPDTHTTLDHEDPAAALQQLRYSRQLPLALEQLLHKDQSNPISGDQHELQSATVVLAFAKRQHHQGLVPTSAQPPSPRSNATARATLA